MKNKRAQKDQSYENNVKPESLKKGNKKLVGPNRPST